MFLVYKQELKDCFGRFFIDSALEFQPPNNKIIDFSEIDVILISNYMNMLALPYITEKTGFKGIIYATEPTLQIGKFFLKELVEYIEASPKTNIAIEWKEVISSLPPPLNEIRNAKSWRHIFSTDDVNNSLSRVNVAGYDQKLVSYLILRITLIINL